MKKQIYGIKGEMTEAYLGDVRTVVTKIQIPIHTISQIKTIEKDGYNNIQVAFGKKRKHPNKSLKGHLKKIKEVPHFIREVPAFKDDVQVGDQFALVDLIERGDVVSVQGVTKGKGFAGAIKRWGFARQPKTHGQSDRVRATGSIGQGTGVGHVFKGKKMPGRLGGLTRTVKNSKVIFIDLENNEVWLTGAVPGNRGALVRLTITSHLDKLPKIKQDQTTKESTVSESVEEKPPVQVEEVAIQPENETVQEQPIENQEEKQEKKEESKEEK